MPWSLWASFDTARYSRPAARAEWRLRADVTTLDLRLVFAATRAAKQVEPEAWPRMLELMIDTLDSHPHQRGARS